MLRLNIEVRIPFINTGSLAADMKVGVYIRAV